MTAKRIAHSESAWSRKQIAKRRKANKAARAARKVQRAST